jgi:penicillin-binding protein 2
MLLFDQLKKNDPQLRALAVAVLGGLFVLLVGLWWVQVVSAREYQANLETQSFRTVRIPAVRGRILDRNGITLAENRPVFNVGLYLEELRKPFEAAYSNQIAHARSELKRQVAEEEKKLRRKLTKEERKHFILTAKEKGRIRQEARYEVASNVVAQVSYRLRQPLSLNRTNFERHYETRLALPFPVLANLNPMQIARFEEQSGSQMGVDLEIQSTRWYPYETTAAHVLGHLRRDDDSKEGEDAFFSFRLPDYRGLIGVECGSDKELRGTAGAKSVLVNNAGYRQTENVWSPAEPGRNVVLTIDLRIQQAVERALQIPPFGLATRGAAVVMDVHSGDILAMASSPAFNPNCFLPSLSRADAQRIAEQHAEKNRAAQENYQPGSIFKTVVGLACLEAGLDPKATIENPGYIDVGRYRVPDTAQPGTYDFHRALKMSSNTYFVDKGLHVAGISNIVKLAQRLHLGERTGLPTRQETPGIFPNLKKVGSSNWRDGDTANMCIGQGPMAVTPIQMAVLASALANGGKVLWPRLVDRIEAPDVTAGKPTTIFPGARVRDELGVKASSLQVVRKAMLADVEEDGTGKQAYVKGMGICGKTGTAQVKNEHHETVGETTWFLSFAPYEEPRYAVVVMVEMEARRGSGGGTCGPVVRQIYTAIRDLERSGAKPETLALIH